MTQNGYEDYQRAEVVDENGEKIGDVAQIYLDDDTGQPSWATVKTGWFGTKETFVPLDSSSLQSGRLHVGYSKDFVKNAPSVDPDQHITDEEQDELYRYYGLGAGNAGQYTSGNTTDRDFDDVTAGTRDTRVGETDDELVRREERLRVGKETTERGRVRLRKHVVTETQQVDVPVSREELRVERVPLDESEQAAGGIGVGQGDDVQEIVLNEERPVVGKETVGVEKVRVGKETITDTETVTADVAKEQVEVDETGTTGTTNR
jgi:uncharacterized protein (TIGR02271 family)